MIMPNMEPSDIQSIDEQLTAYLDGELSPQESLSLERSLVEDESLRLRLAELRKAYDLLDELPETPHDQRFTQSTLEHVIHEVRSEKSKPLPSTETIAIAIPKKFAYRFPLLLGIVALLGGLTGAFVRYQQMNNEIRSLGLAANISGLITVNELPVAIELAKEIVAIRYLKEYFAEKLIPAIPQTNWERRTWFNSLTPVQQAKIESDRQSLSNMDNQSRARYSAIETQIQSRPDHEDIHETIRLVGLVMDNLQSFEKLEMDELAKDIRIHYLRQKMYYFAAMHYFSNKLTDQDQKTIKAWSDKVLEPGLINLGRDMGPNRPRFEGMIYMYLFRKMNGFASTQDEQLEEEVIRLLLPDLSDDARVLLANVRQNNQLMLLANSCLTPIKLASEESIVEYYNKIPLNRREELEVADPELSRNRIRQFYDEAARRRMRPRP